MPVSEKNCRMRRKRQVPPGFCPRRGTYTAGSARAPSGSARGCKGRSPLHEITIVSPFPPGRGTGGWGKESTLKAGSAGDKKRQAPLAHRQHPPPPAPPGTSPPPQYLLDWYCKCRKRSNVGAPGAKPPAKLTYSLPLPRRGRGGGGMGERKHTEGRVSRRQKRQAPLAHRQPPYPPRRAGHAPPPQYLLGWYCKRRRRQAPPLGAWFAPLLRCPLRLSPGMQGAKPLA